MFFIHSKNCKNCKYCKYFDIESEETNILLFADRDVFKINEFRILTDNEYEIIQNCVKEILDKINYNKIYKMNIFLIYTILYLEYIIELFT